MEVHKMAAVFKALGDDNRIQILRMLQSGEKCACNLLEELQITQPTLSHHMKILCDAGIVVSRRDGIWIHYDINCECISKIRMLMWELLSDGNIPEQCKEG